MGTVLMTWELGAGLGHLVRLLPIAQGLLERGHRVYAAVRDLAAAQSVFGSGLLSVLQAPIQVRLSSGQIEKPFTFAHILQNFGFSDERDLAGRLEAWTELYRLVKPDLILFDHSPTALMAARGLPARKALIGSGFFCPPDEYPMPNLRGWLQPDLEQMRKDEDAVLAGMNHLLEQRRQPTLERITQLYAQVDENFLVTFAELDHYPNRKGASYWGAWTKISGKAPQWPQGPGPRIYAYFKQFEQLEATLKVLADLPASILIYSDGINAALQKRFTSDKLRFENSRLDLEEIGRTCDLAILNGNHGTTISLLMKGRPILQLPISLEQALLSLAVEKFGAALGADIKRPAHVERRLREMLNSKRFAAAARRFAEKYSSFDAEQQAKLIVQRLEHLMSGA
jgi:UDP:flavonoid glycosyltransferase YjiC (YdhE family)